MNKLEKEEKKSKLTSEFDTRVAVLLLQIENLIIERDKEIKVRQDEIDSLTLQSEVLTSFKIK